MPSLSEDLQTAKNTLDEFRSIAERVLNYMPEMINEKIDYLDYSICASTTAGTRKTIRPFNKNLFIKNSDQFNDQYNEFSKTINKLHDNVLSFQKEKFDTVDKIIYTIQQSIGIGLDLLVEPNSARKHVGNRFEELIRTLFNRDEYFDQEGRFKHPLRNG